MKFAKSMGLAAGFVGTFGLGVLVGPSIVGHDHASRATAQTMPAAPTGNDELAAPVKPAPAVTPKAKRTAPASGFAANRPVVVVPPATHPELQARLKPVLNRGADMSKAADGFRNAEEFATVAHAARETRVPFMLLKHRVLEEGMTLEKAITASRTDVDAGVAVQHAKAAAADDVKAL